jgi:hypothetical protein
MIMYNQNPYHTESLQKLERLKSNFQEYEYDNQKILKQHEEEIASEKYYFNTLILAIISLLIYYVGCCLIIFIQNIDGEAVVILNTYPLSWQLFFENFPQFISNFLNNVFGYFIEYGRLFGFFENRGNLYIEPKAKYLLPVDIFIKILTIGYFHFFWMKWDTQKATDNNWFNSNYPFAKVKSKTKNKTPDEEIEKEIFDPSLVPTSRNLNIVSNQNLLIQNPTINSNLDDDDDDDDDENISLLPFTGVQKPLEEFFIKNEDLIYSFIRTKILPGSNILFTLYFSTRSVLSFSQPLGILAYIFGIMSMFWCMQSFLLVLDHTQFRPEEEGRHRTD